MQPAIIVHGGAWNIPDGLVERSKKGILNAVRAGYKVLDKGGTPMDAVCVAICVLEDDDAFNAGHGSVLTEEGEVEMDAFVMEGKTLNTGAVTCVERISNPILLARDVMEKTSHCCLAGPGALKFAKQMGYEILENNKLLLPAEELLKHRQPNGEKYRGSVTRFFNSIQKSKDLAELGTSNISSAENHFNGNAHDTVGAVAIDAHGNIACGTSTGGIAMKMAGRVGDTPLIGCGGYANDFGGASATGHGESILRTMLCREVVYKLQSGEAIQNATEKSVKKTHELTGGRCGIIAIDKEGHIGFSFTTCRMVWAYISNGVLHYGIDPGENIVDTV